MIACFLVMFLKGLESERDLAEYLKNHKELLPALGLPRAPVATTLGRLHKRYYSERLNKMVRLIPNIFYRLGIPDSLVVALADKKYCSSPHL